MEEMEEERIQYLMEDEATDTGFEAGDYLATEDAPRSSSETSEGQ